MMAEQTPTRIPLDAWLLPIGKGMEVAIGQRELKYIEYLTQPVELPGLPAYCKQGFLWRGRFVPALDLLSLATRRRSPGTDGDNTVAIVAYEQRNDLQLGLGAICLRGIPRHIQLDARSQAADVNSLQGIWQLLAAAAFCHDEQIYPVLDLGQLFNTTPNELMTLH